MAFVFLYGSLRHLPLLAVVLGRTPDPVPARLAGHAVFWAEGHGFPLLAAAPGAFATGLLLAVTPDERARLDAYELGFGYDRVTVQVDAPAGAVAAEVYWPRDGHYRPGAPWRIEDWAVRWGAIATEAARDFMAVTDLHPPEALRLRYPMMLARAASRIAARRGRSPATLRAAAAPGDVVLDRVAVPYLSYFALEETQVRFRRFDGALSDPVPRSVLVMADAVCVMPYDPLRDRVLLIEQFRPGPERRGDPNPWLLEIVAGRVDPGETPEQAARREAQEEAGLALGDLIRVPGHYPLPAAATEFIHAFLALAELPDQAPRIGGLDEEHEDIRSHVVSFDALMALIDRGEVTNGPMMVTALWLARVRPRLRAAAVARRP